MIGRIQKRSKRLFDIRGPVVRATAIAFAAFMLLASGRALVPGMCATQTALAQAAEAQRTDNASWRVQKACCAVFPLGVAHDAPEAPVSSVPVCAFCNLSHAILDAPVPVFFAAPVVLYNEAVQAAESILLSRDLDPALLGRAPPATFA